MDPTGDYNRVARVFLSAIGRPAVMRTLTRTGLRSRPLMEWVLKVMANLLEPEDRGMSERVYGMIEHLNLTPAERAEHFKICPECQLQHLNDDAGKAIYQKAGDLGVPVGFMVSPAYFGQIDDLLTEFPETPAIIDHFGGCKPSNGAGAANPDWEAL
ncbi:MAG: amidohydrolase family protein, partial [Planctomycetes bacterium]|nr:amidohydrolase family protein [Planctomycetota bacterium]